MHRNPAARRWSVGHQRCLEPPLWQVPARRLTRRVGALAAWRSGGENATTPAGSRPFERTSWNRSARHGVLMGERSSGGATEGKTPVSVIEALRSWRYAKAQPTAAVRRVQSHSAVRLVLTIGACMAAMLLLVVPLLTLEADARGGGGGGHGGGGHFAGFGGHGGGGGGHGGGGHGGGGHFAGFG